MHHHTYNLEQTYPSDYSLCKPYAAEHVHLYVTSFIQGGQKWESQTTKHHHQIQQRERERQSIQGKVQPENQKQRWSQEVVVKEELIATRGTLAHRTRTLKKEGRIMDCWTVAGKIMVKNKNGLVVNITTDAELSAYGQV